MEQLSFGWYLPLVVAGLVYLILFTATRVVRARGEAEGADRLADLGFAIVLGTAAYTALLLVLALITFPGRLGSLVFITVIVAAFFLLLLLLLFGLFEMFFARGERDREPAGGEPIQPS